MIEMSLLEFSGLKTQRAPRNTGRQSLESEIKSIDRAYTMRSWFIGALWQRIQWRN